MAETGGTGENEQNPGLQRTNLGHREYGLGRFGLGLRLTGAKGYLARQSGLTADTLGIPMAWISVAVPVSMIIILIHLFARWAGDDTVEETTAQLD